MHAIVRHPPPAGGRALVYGAGALGVTSVAALKALYPDVAVAVVARFEAQKQLALQARSRSRREPRAKARAHPGPGRLVRRSAPHAVRRLAGGEARRDRRRLRHDRPTRDPRGRCPGTRRAGTLVQTGVSTPGRYEWTPIYFKELTLAGSNAFGFEDIEGTRKHAIAHYLDLVASRPDRPRRDAHPPFPTRGMVGRDPCARSPGDERCDQDRVRARHPLRPPVTIGRSCHRPDLRNRPVGEPAQNWVSWQGGPQARGCCGPRAGAPCASFSTPPWSSSRNAGYHAARVDDIVKLAKHLARDLLPVLLEQRGPASSALSAKPARSSVPSTPLSDRSSPGPDGWLALRGWMERFSVEWQRYAPVLRAWTDLLMSDVELTDTGSRGSVGRRLDPRDAYRRGESGSRDRAQCSRRSRHRDGRPLPLHTAVRRRARGRRGPRHPHDDGPQRRLQRDRAACESH